MFKLIEGGTMPQIKTEFSSSADLCAREDVIIMAGETKIIPLGVKIDIQDIDRIVSEYFHYLEENIDKSFDDLRKEFMESHFFELKLRSSLAIKKGLIIANGVGEIDIDYPDEIGLIVHNPITSKTSDMMSKNNILAYELKKENVNDSEILKYQQEFLEKNGGIDAVSIKIKAGERVAQIKLMEHKNFLMPSEYRSDKKRTGGYGSTNK